MIKVSDVLESVLYNSILIDMLPYMHARFQRFQPVSLFGPKCKEYRLNRDYWREIKSNEA